MTPLNAHPGHSPAIDPLASFVAIARKVDGMASWSVGHSRRVSLIASEIARVAGWASVETARLRRVAELHDIGKLCVSEEVLGAPGHLDSAARAEVELHAALGANMLATVLDPVEVSWVRHHHERWDGGGYPDGLCADGIPRGASIIALSEAWDAMLTPSPLRTRPLSAEEAWNECQAGSGTQFAPWAVTALGHAICVTSRALAPSL
jgi:HD-GYP domain-containing protein (c-di-GMP phosphodiesterase class II)